jgi:hypothetical protein
MRYFLLCIISIFSIKLYSQGCCSGGSGSPIAGGASQGVLQDRQMEFGLNYQYAQTNKFYVKNKDTASLFDDFRSNYLYFRLAYGVTKAFTMSVESGYFINKTQIEKDKADTISSSGIADLILFPRYTVYNHSTENSRSEITLGLGYKIPLGKHDDSTVVYTDPSTGENYYTPLPPTVQPTNGSQDFIFYGFLFKGYPVKNFRIFSNMIYIRKGWNSLGQKFGDYASVGLFVGKTFYKKIGVTLQLKGERINKMQYDKKIDMLALYNIDVTSTGSTKLFLAPQFSYTIGTFTIFALSEFPFYQYLNGTQVGSQYQATLGLSYRFFTAKSVVKAEIKSE